MSQKVSCDIESLLSWRIAEINTKESLLKKLQSGKKLRIKFGIDPTGTDLTLGHAVVLRKLRQFQDAGHQVVLLFGDYTAKIGDPTGKTTVRKVLNDEEIQHNVSTYISQVSKILNIDEVEVVYNSHWLSKLSFSDILSLAGNFTVAQMLERDMFQERIQKELPINMVEFMYPLMQGYDSLPMKADIEIGGTDQLFNMMSARVIQKNNGLPVQDVITVPLLVGTDGKEKMSKSLGNYIAIQDSARDMFGKIMSLPDEAILDYFHLTTDVSLKEREEYEKKLKAGENPRNIKVILAKEVVALYFSEKTAQEEELYFESVFQKKHIPDDIPEICLEKKEYQLWDLINILKFCTSNAESKRMIEQGGVKLNDEKKTDPYEMIPIQGGEIISVGKRKWIQVQ
jgi:tyrosyl-tRNA synthetase